MEPATRFLYGPEAVTAAVATAYTITVNDAWIEVAHGALCWAVCGASLQAILAGGAWWILHCDAKRRVVDDEVIIAGRIGEVIRHPTQRAA
jgi:hypothetical protein